jgi:predicted TIM-barrel fold metal-dependent hydrolase
MVANLVLSGARHRFAGIRIIATHGGGTIPYLAPRLCRAGAMPWAYPGGPPLSSAEIEAGLASFHYDLTAATSQAALSTLTRIVPIEHLLMGFDYPLMGSQTIAPALAAFEAHAGFDAQARERICRGNALGLFPRLAESVPV